MFVCGYGYGSYVCVGVAIANSGYFLMFLFPMQAHMPHVPMSHTLPAIRSKCARCILPFAADIFDSHSMPCPCPLGLLFANTILHSRHSSPIHISTVSVVFHGSLSIPCSPIYCAVVAQNKEINTCGVVLHSKVGKM